MTQPTKISIRKLTEGAGRPETIKDMAREMALKATDLYSNIEDHANAQTQIENENIKTAIKVEALRQAADYLIEMAEEEERLANIKVTH